METKMRTLIRFLEQAVRPVGRVLYIYGGGWNLEDTGGDEASSSMGLSAQWTEFFECQDESFSYREYRTMGWNQYHELGLDCSGYVGWAVYNTLQERSGGASFVVKASRMAQTYASYGWGSFAPGDGNPDHFRPGDIFSMQGHVWICIGRCRDGSMVIAHATPSESRSGCPGGGVQLGAIGWTERCRAYRLAESYMCRYRPKWSRRYCAVQNRPEVYLNGKAASCGRFSWYTDERGLCDPERMADMDAEAVLKKIF